MLPLNMLFADDPNNANIIATAAIPKIKANFAGEIDSKLNTLISHKNIKKFKSMEFEISSKPILRFDKNIVYLGINNVSMLAKP